LTQRVEPNHLSLSMNLSIVKKISIQNCFIFLYIILTILIYPFGEFTLGDDFYFKLQVDSFINNEFKKSALIDPVFIGQGILGYLWSLIFGSSFNSLKVLSILSTAIYIIFLNKIFKLLNFNSSQIILGNTICIFNPFVWLFSYTFNTESFFIMFSVISLFFILKFQKTLNSSDYNYSIIFSILAFSVRQYGIIFFAIIFYILATNKKINYYSSIKLFIGIFLCILLLFYPKYQNLNHIESISPLSILNISNLSERLVYSYEFIPYIGLFFLVLLPLTLKKISRKLLIIILISSIFLSFLIFNLNIFSLGNVLYLEGIGAKSFTELEISSTNNTVVKYFASLLLVFSFLTTVVYLIELKSKQVFNKQETMLIIGMLLSFTISSLSTKVFDRYYILFFILVTIFTINSLKITKLYIVNIFLIIFFILINFFYIQESYNNLRTKWLLAEVLVNKKITTEKNIFVSINYSKYHTYKENNLNGLNNRYNLSDFKCYVQNYSKGDLNNIGMIIEKSESYILEKLKIENPKIEEFGYTKSLKGKRAKNSILIDEKPLFNPFYNIIGIEMGIRSFCNL